MASGFLYCAVQVVHFIFSMFSLSSCDATLTLPLLTNLRGVMVEDDGAEVTAVVVCNEVLCGVGALQAACSDALVLQQRLVQSKQHLQRERERERQEGCCYFLHPLIHFSVL